MIEVIKVKQKKQNNCHPYSESIIIHSNLCLKKNITVRLSRRQLKAKTLFDKQCLSTLKEVLIEHH